MAILRIGFRFFFHLHSKTEINRGLLSLIESTDRINGSKIGACYAEELCLVKGCLGSENLFKILF